MQHDTAAFNSHRRDDDKQRAIYDITKIAREGDSGAGAEPGFLGVSSQTGGALQIASSFLGWNDDTIALLRLYWADGLSTAEIGSRLGCSKNAVVGKAHRLQLSRRPSPITHKLWQEKLTPDQRRVARERFVRGSPSRGMRALARHFGISCWSMSKILASAA
jgi:hypothetical protein